MPLCPSCKTEQAKRKGGKCPSCGVSITLDRGEWMLGDPKLTSRFIKSWDRNQRVRLRVDFFISTRSLAYGAEIKFASKLITEAGSIDTALEALNYYYTDKRFSWINTNSLRYLYNSWGTVLALVRKEQEKKELERNSARLALEGLDTLEIFKEIYESK